MVEKLRIRPSGPVRGSIQPPGSKSITNRALVCAALADGVSRLAGALDSEDTRVMVDALRQLGLTVEWASANTIELRGCAGRIPADQADLFVGNSGTTIRFLTAMLAAGRGVFRLDGVPRMRKRPLGDLLETLGQLGGDAQSENNDDCPPVVIRARGLAGGRVAIRGDISSQFLSGLLMAAPLASGDVEVSLRGELVSRPYVDMTLSVMSDFGVDVTKDDDAFLIRAGQAYLARDYAIEPDASAASYFWGAAAITEGSVTVRGLHRQALQGDVQFCDCLQRMGCRIEYRDEGIQVSGRPLKGIDCDMSGISDTVQTLAAIALFAEGATRIRGVGHIRHKETDRIADLARELRRLGAGVDEMDDGLLITPGRLRGAAIETYDDHRMAMSLSLVGLRVPDVVIKNPNCTRKTYPRFFEDLAKVRDT